MTARKKAVLRTGKKKKLMTAMLSLAVVMSMGVSVQAASGQTETGQAASGQTAVGQEGEWDEFEKGEQKYQYTVNIYAGKEGYFSSTGTSQKSITVDAGSELSIDISDLVVNDPDQYYARGMKIAGHDNDEISTRNYQSYTWQKNADGSGGLDQDYNFSVAYGIAGGMVKYTVNYVDEAGKELEKAEDYYGMVGDKPVVSYKYVEGYRPNAYNQGKTLVEDESQNVFTFTYKRLVQPTPEPTPAPTATPTPTPTAAPSGGGTSSGGGGGSTGGSTSGGSTGGGSTSGGTNGGSTDGTTGGAAGTAGGTTGGNNQTAPAGTGNIGAPTQSTQNGANESGGTNGTAETTDTSGTNGTDGASGTNGTNGTNSTNGTNGTDETNETNGSEGTNGADRSAGAGENAGTERNNGRDGTTDTAGTGDTSDSRSTSGTAADSNDRTASGRNTQETGVASTSTSASEAEGTGAASSSSTAGNNANGTQERDNAADTNSQSEEPAEYIDLDDPDTPLAGVNSIEANNQTEMNNQTDAKNGTEDAEKGGLSTGAKAGIGIAVAAAAAAIIAILLGRKKRTE